MKPTGMPVAAPVPRKQTPIAMPAPPAAVTIEEKDRESYDDLEQIARIDKVERERIQLLAKNQDLEQENRLLREMAPTHPFPPPSIPPPASASTPTNSVPPIDIKALEKQLRKGGWDTRAVKLGIFLAIVWNAFNSYRSLVPEKKVDNIQARVTQNEKLSEKEITERVLIDQRNLQALRAMQCWGRQLRGGFQRQGLELPSLPAGGITVFKVSDDPALPGPPKFVATEGCPEFPKLPPDGALR